MFFELSIIRHLIAQLRSRLQVLRAEPEAGYSTEAVVVIALLVAMAITAVGIIAAKVISTAHNISTGGLRRLSERAMGSICRWRDERGSATAELVIATPLLLLLILGIVQFALWEHATHVAQAVAEQGLAVGRVQGGTDQAATAEAQSVLGQLGSGVLVHPNVSATRGAATTTVVVTGQAEGILPFLSLPVRSVATGPSERFTTSGQGP